MHFLRNSMRIAVLAIVVALCGCASQSSHSDADEAFGRLADEFIKGHLKWRPAMGTYLGLHEYDGRVTDLSKGSIDAEVTRLKDFEMALAELKGRRLNRQNDYDLRILQSAVRSELFRLVDMDAYHKNPMSYADVIDVNIYIKRNFAPLEQRVRSIIAIEKQAANIMANARANLEESLGKPYVETAMDVAPGSGATGVHTIAVAAAFTA